MRTLPPGCDPVRIELNQLAHRFYSQAGYEMPEPTRELQPWNYEGSTHPQEQHAFRLALVAWEFFHGDSADYDEETDH